MAVILIVQFQFVIPHAKRLREWCSRTNRCSEGEVSFAYLCVRKYAVCFTLFSSKFIGICILDFQTFTC